MRERDRPLPQLKYGDIDFCPDVVDVLIGWSTLMSATSFASVKGTTRESFLIAPHETAPLKVGKHKDLNLWNVCLVRHEVGTNKWNNIDRDNAFDIFTLHLTDYCVVTWQQCKECMHVNVTIREHATRRATLYHEGKHQLPIKLWSLTTY